MLLAHHLFNVLAADAGTRTGRRSMALELALTETADVHQAIWEGFDRAERAVVTALADGQQPDRTADGPRARDLAQHDAVGAPAPCPGPAARGREARASSTRCSPSGYGGGDPTTRRSDKRSRERGAASSAPRTQTRTPTTSGTPASGSTARTPGNLGAWMLRRDEGERTEFVTLSFWESEAAIRAFAGEDIEAAVLYPEDERYLIGESSVTHHRIVDTVSTPCA